VKCPYQPGWGGGMFVQRPIPCTLKALGGLIFCITIAKLRELNRPTRSEAKSGCIPNIQ